MTQTLTQLEQLQARFEPSEHQTRTQGGKELTYISIDATINRLNRVLGANWSTQGNSRMNRREDGTFDAFCEMWLTATVDGTQKQCYGVGAMANKDADMAAKTALAEALKKCGHQLGIGLYLWDPEARDEVTAKMKLVTNPNTLKAKIYEIAVQKTGIEKPTPSQIAGAFQIETEQLKDLDLLAKLLDEHKAAA